MDEKGMFAVPGQGAEDSKTEVSTEQPVAAQLNVTPETTEPETTEPETTEPEITEPNPVEGEEVAKPVSFEDAGPDALIAVRLTSDCLIGKHYKAGTVTRLLKRQIIDGNGKLLKDVKLVGKGAKTELTQSKVVNNPYGTPPLLRDQ